MTAKTVPQILREAADHVEKVGLGKGDFFKPMGPGEIPVSERPCCAMGAVSYASGYWVEDPDTHGLLPPSAQYAEQMHTDEEIQVIYAQDSLATRALNHQLRRAGLGISIPTWSDAHDTTTADVAAQLRAAADHMERVGLNQDGNFYAQQYDRDVVEPTDERPCCTVGALMVASRNHDYILGHEPWNDYVNVRYEAQQELARALDPSTPAHLAHQFIIDWSDRSSTTQEKVLELLRTTADKIEKGTDQ